MANIRNTPQTRRLRLPEVLSGRFTQAELTSTVLMVQNQWLEKAAKRAGS